MRQGRSISELGKELQRQRLNRQDFLVNTRSLEMKSDPYGSKLHMTSDDKSHEFQIEEIAHQQIAAQLNIPFRYYARRLYT